MRRRAQGAAIALAALLLTACAARQSMEQPPPLGWDARRALLLDIPAWNARGRIALRSDRGGGQGNFRWQQRDVTSRLMVSGPFGAGAYEVILDPDSVVVSSKDGEQQAAYEGPDAAERFVSEQVGWSFPAGSARYWLMGLPDPAGPAEEIFDESGELVGLRQGGWLVEIRDYRVLDRVRMPRRLVMTRDDARVRLVVDEWNLGP